MKLIYFRDYDVNPKSGVNKKVISQAIALNGLGIDVELALVEGGNSIYGSYSFIKSRKVHEIDSVSNWNIFLRIKRQYTISKIFEDILKNSDSKTVVYVRYPLPIFFCPWRYKKIKKCIVVTEHNAIEPSEYILTKNYFATLIDFINGKMIRRNSNGIVGVTQEIVEYQVKRSGDQDKPHITIGNGIDVKTVNLRNPPNFNGEELKLLIIANINRWHGIDRLIEGMKDYKGDTRISLHVVGEGTELENLKKLTHKFDKNYNILFYGFKSGQDLDKLFDKCHIAIGSLAIHRNALRMTSALKIREYTARGIPFIISGLDSDFSTNFPYIYRIMSDESKIDLYDIVNFAKKIYKDPIHHTKMREFAINNLDWSIKMKLLRDFCESLVKDQNNTK